MGKIEIVRRPLDSGVHYITRENGSYLGFADLDFFNLSEFCDDCPEDDEIREHLREKGILPWQKMGEIFTFHPNGQGGAIKTRRGIGSLVLEQMIADAREFGAKILVGSTERESMQGFLGKKGFSEYNFRTFSYGL